MTQNACDEANTLPKIKNKNNIQGFATLPRMGYSTRNKKPNSKNN